jgi:hypothetical protein
MTTHNLGSVTLPNGSAAALHVDSHARGLTGFVYVNGKRVYGTYGNISFDATTGIKPGSRPFTPTGKHADLVAPVAELANA